MRISDVFVMSLGAIGGNKLRSFLTLVGIVLGVASIIGVMTAISVMQTTMEKEMTVLGAQTFQLQKWPNGFSSHDQQRAAQKWPPVTLDEAQAIREQVSSVDLVGTEIWDYGKVASYKGITTEPSITLCGGSPEYSENNTQFIGEGRNLSRMDMLASRRVAVLGNALAQQLFPFTDPIGKTILLDGRKFEVIGVFVKKVSAFGGPYETMALIPSGAYTQIYGMIDREGFPRSVNVTVHSKTPELLPDAIEQVRQVMRNVRHLKHDDKEDKASHTRHHTVAIPAHTHNSPATQHSHHGHAEQALHLAVAAGLGAVGEFRIIHALKHLEALPAFFTFVIVVWHGAWRVL